MGICRLYVGSLATICMLSVNGIPARAEQKTLTDDTRFCPSWAEAHERTLASLNNGRPPYPVHWKEGFLTEIVIKGRHWFADE